MYHHNEFPPFFEYAPGPPGRLCTNPLYSPLPSRLSMFSQNAITLTGSHIWHNFHDGLVPAQPAPRDQNRRLRRVPHVSQEHANNFIRLCAVALQVHSVRRRRFICVMTPHHVAKKPSWGEHKYGQPKVERMLQRVRSMSYVRYALPPPPGIVSVSDQLARQEGTLVADTIVAIGCQGYFPWVRHRQRRGHPYPPAQQHQAGYRSPPSLYLPVLPSLSTCP